MLPPCSPKPALHLQSTMDLPDLPAGTDLLPHLFSCVGVLRVSCGCLAGVLRVFVGSSPVVREGCVMLCQGGVTPMCYTGYSHQHHTVCLLCWMGHRLLRWCCAPWSDLAFLPT